MRGRRLLIRGVVVAAVVGAAVFARPRIDAQAPTPQQATVSFTAEQANTGHQTYFQRCAACHGDVDGIGAAPPLADVSFHHNWAGRPVEELFTYLKTRMPPAGSPQAQTSTTDQQYADIVAYLLARNGMRPGERALAPDAASLRAYLPWVLPQGGGELGSVASIPAPPPGPNPLSRLTAVTDAMLASPPPGEWLAWRRTLDSQGFSPLTQITKANVANLRTAWSWTLPAGTNEATPLVHDGVLFVQSWGDQVQAIDAATGELLWQFVPRQGPRVVPVVKRAIALYGENVYLATSGGHVAAVSARQGHLIWDRALDSPPDGANTQYPITSGPIVAKGTVMVGTAGSAPGGNVIVGLDAASGAEKWRVPTIARPGAPGGDSWNGLPVEKRSGASVYVPGSYDAELGLAFFGTAQTYDTAPLRDAASASNVTNEALHTDSTLAIDPETGRVVWHFQHLANDQWDLDWALEQLLIRIPGRSKTMLATAGKQAIYDVLDADTGAYAFSMDLGLQDVVTAIDTRTGAKTIDASKLPAGGRTVSVCPHSGGAKSWLPESFNGAAQRLFVPLNEACMDLVPVPPGGRGMLSTNVRWTLKPRSGSDGKYGRLQAIDLGNRRDVWTTRQRAPLTTGVLATAGGLVFVGGLDRRFGAYDDATGLPLWSVRLNDVPNGAPVTFMAGGKQYIALTVGNGGALATSFPLLLPELKNPLDKGAAIWVFELP